MKRKKKNNSIKLNLFLKLSNAVNYATPVNINYFWNFGSLAGLALFIQILTGIILAMHYTPHVDLAFSSIVHIMRDLNYGWFLRYVHANGASMFFIIVYFHIFKGLYYGSYMKPTDLAWVLGIIIYFLMMGAGFLGYVLPWGQMSFWGATVITNFISAIPKFGSIIVEWVWGGFAVNNATLNRIFSLHYLLPFIIGVLALVHVAVLHIPKSNNPLGIKSSYNYVPINPYFTFKDYFGYIIFILIFLIFVFFFPTVLGDSANYLEANPLVTPSKIVPEWYFLPFYTILRSIPNKRAGICMMVLAILILLILPYKYTFNIKKTYFKLYNRYFYWIFVATFLILGWLGGQHAEPPYVGLGQIATIYYFFYLTIIQYYLGSFEYFLLRNYIYIKLFLKKNKIANYFNKIIKS